MELLDRLEPGSALGATLGPMKAVIYRQDRTADARIIASGIREDFIKLKGRVSVLDTVVPHAKAYKEAATLRIPVHRHERKRDGVTPSAYTVMHQLAWELIPSLQGVRRLPMAPGSRERGRSAMHAARPDASLADRARRRLVAESLQVGNPGNNARDLPAQADPRRTARSNSRSTISVPTSTTRGAPATPSSTRSRNRSAPAVSAIPLTVTRRPGESHFIVEAGGNTRLLAIRQLWAETRDAAFPQAGGPVSAVALREPRAHRAPHRERAARRDDLLGQGSGVVALKARLEAGAGHAPSRCASSRTRLNALGLSVNTATLAHYLFATERLATLGEAVADLSGLDVKTLQPRLNAMKRYAQTRTSLAEDELYAWSSNRSFGERRSSTPTPGTSVSLPRARPVKSLWPGTSANPLTGCARL